MTEVEKLWELIKRWIVSEMELLLVRRIIALRPEAPLVVLIGRPFGGQTCEHQQCHAVQAQCVRQQWRT